MTALASEYTVESMLSLYQQNLTTPFDEKIITLEGFFKQFGTQVYGGCYYDKLYDEDKNHFITILVKEKYRKQLVSGQYYKFNGYVNKGNRPSKDGTFQINYRITKIVDHLDEHQFISKEEFDLVRERMDREAYDIREHLLTILRKDQKPRITIFLGNSSIVDEDYRSQLVDEHLFELDEVRTSFANPNHLNKILANTSKQDTDLVVCMRGGGSGLEVFNNVELAKKSLTLDCPFVTAIGHKEDVTLLQRMADKGFSTPTAFGGFLTEIQNIFNREIKDRVEFHNQIKTLNEKVDVMQKQRIAEQTEYNISLHKNKQELEKKTQEIQNNFEQKNERNRRLIKRLSLVLIFIILCIAGYVYLNYGEAIKGF